MERDEDKNRTRWMVVVQPGTKGTDESYGRQGKNHLVPPVNEKSCLIIPDDVSISRKPLMKIPSLYGRRTFSKESSGDAREGRVNKKVEPSNQRWTMEVLLSEKNL